MCLAPSQSVIPHPLGFSPLTTAGEKQIDQSTAFDVLPREVSPATAGSGGAARGLERELKGIVATQEKA